MTRIDSASSSSIAGDHASPSAGNETSTVQVGESDLSQVAQRLGLDLTSLLEANPKLGNSGNLQAGQDICTQGVRSAQTTGEEIAGAGEQSPSFSTSSSGPSTLAANEMLAKAMVQFRLDGRSPQTGTPGTPPPVLRWNPDPNTPNPNVTKSTNTQKSPNTNAQINQLQDAARTGDLKKIAAVINSGIDVNAKGSDGQTPLMAAAAMGNTHAMEMLIGAGALVDEPGADGKTALMKAIHTGQDDSVELLLKKGADVNHADNDKNTPLMLAINDGRQTMVSSLIAAKANLDVQQKDGKTALMLAVEKGDDATVTALMQAGANPSIQDNNKKTALMGLIQDAHANGKTPNLSIAKALIKASKPADLNKLDADGKTVMMQAASSGFKRVFMELLDAKADPDIKDANGRTAIMELLGRSSSGASNLPADQSLSSTEMKALIAASKNIDLRDNKGRSALMEAASNGHNAAVLALVESKKVDVNAKDKLGNTALINFSTHPNDLAEDPTFNAAAKALIAATGKKNLDYKLPDGTTALMAAARSHNPDMVRALNAAGANLNAQDNRGRTALMLAAKSGDKWSVRFLLDKDWRGEGSSGLHKADPSIKDKNNQTAAAMAKDQLQNGQGLSDLDKVELQKIIDILP
jgi:uncharacterized protein